VSGQSVSNQSVSDQSIRAGLLETADRCVKCGLCLPHCPTYRIKEDEAESPRGRIALIQGLAQGALAGSPKLWGHLANCLECRACEAACPSLVAFGSLMDAARDLQSRSSSPWRRWRKRIRLRLLSNRKGAAAAAFLSRFYRGSGLGLLIGRLGLPVGSRLWAYHRVAMRLDRDRPSPGGRNSCPTCTQEIALFLGCVAPAMQPGLSRAARDVLERVGYRVRIPDSQCCCGAMHRHNGFPSEADRLLVQNASAFSDLKVVVTASACAAELRSHPGMGNTVEICRLLADLKWPPGAVLKPLPARVAVHEPCSHRNHLHDADAIYALLQRIPKLEILPLEENAFCCGAAGTYLLDNPMLSSSLLAGKIGFLQGLEADYLVTSNTGCALHLAAGVREAGMSLEVLHPVELIARQLVSRSA
jgi:glycolate oxidase iron-sulfur subunit